MEAPIVVACIAAVVSVVSVVATVFVARQGRRAGFKQLAFSAALKSVETSVHVIRAIASHTERVRISCWEIRRALDASPDVIGKQLADGTEKLGSAFKGYFDEWAEAKAEIPHTDLREIQHLRHDSRNKCIRLMSMLQIYLDGNASVPIDREEVRRRVVDLQSDLESLFSRLADIKNSMVFDLLTTAEPRL